MEEGEPNWRQTSLPHSPKSFTPRKAPVWIDHDDHDENSTLLQPNSTILRATSDITDLPWLRRLTRPTPSSTSQHQTKPIYNVRLSSEGIAHLVLSDQTSASLNLPTTSTIQNQNQTQTIVNNQTTTKPSKTTPSLTRNKIEQGNQIKAKVDGWTNFYPGKITMVNNDGTYDIQFQDGEQKKNVLEAQIQGSIISTPANQILSARNKGDRVKAKVSGWKKFYSGSIVLVNKNGTYDIKFEDGEQKLGVTESQIQGTVKDIQEREHIKHSNQKTDANDSTSSPVPKLNLSRTSTSITSSKTNTN